MQTMLMVGAVALAWSTTAVAQTASFKCPPAGTLVEYSDGSWTKWGEGQSQYCRLTNRLQNGNETVWDWYAPTALRRTDQTTAWIEQVKPSSLWPLSVGKKLAARYNGPGIQGNISIVSDIAISVDAYERVTTNAGVFDAFVLTHRQDAISGSYKSTGKQWYAPDPGIIVKFEYADNTGAARKGEAVSVKR